MLEDQMRRIMEQLRDIYWDILLVQDIDLSDFLLLVAHPMYSHMGMGI